MSGPAVDTRSRKRELRKLNRLIWEGRTDVFAVKPPLDTSFKKNTAVIKRFRTSLTPDSTASLLKDISTVSLEKYLAEVISAVSEGLLKAKLIGEITTAVEIVSALHQRFGKAFTPFIVWNVARGLSTPGKEQLRALPQDQREKEESTRLARQRILLRVATELWLVGVIRTLDDAINPDESATAASGSKTGDNAKKQAPQTLTRSGDDDPLPLEALKDILARDRDGSSLSLVVLFIKNFAWDVLGVKARATARKPGADDANGANNEAEPQANGNGVAEGESDQSLTDVAVQIRFRNVLSNYFIQLRTYIVGEHRRLQQQAKRNSEAYVRSGEVFEDRQQAFEKATKAHEKLVANAQIVAEALSLDMPDLRDEDEIKDVGEGMIRETGSMFKKGEDGTSGGMWEDDDQRRFYEDVIDLRVRVPSVLLDEGRKAASGPAEGNGEAKLDTTDEELAVKAGDLDLNDGDTSIANKTIGAQVDALLIRLPELTNRDLIDTFAFDFCFLNSKASRNRLIKVLEDIPKGRADLLPYYARLIASLSKAGLTDIASAMVTYLDKEFRSLQKRKEKEQLSAIRTQNAKYISEMTKFGLVPEHVIFHCLKVALDDFSRMNIDIICTILESCGRYLLKTPTTQPRMSVFLETLQRKKAAHHISAQDRVLIENAFYYVSPPERPAIVPKERTPAELFIRKLIYLDLNKRNYNKTIKSLRKLHWEDPKIVNQLIKICTKIWKVKYSNIFLIAILVFGLFRYHQDFGIRVVDGVLENIRVGLEQNDFRQNQQRIATIKYLGELYNYKMIDSPVIFDTLYLILSFGYSGTPRPGDYNPLDPPDNCFRVRLVCTLLDTCGECFDRGSSKKKLDFFLAFFQYYIHIKVQVPMDIEFMVQDTFQMVRPNWVLHQTLEEAGKAFEEAALKVFGPAETAAGKKGDDDTSSGDDETVSNAEDDDGKLSDDEGENARGVSKGPNETAGIGAGLEDDDTASEGGLSAGSGDRDRDSGDEDDEREDRDEEEDVVYSRTGGPGFEEWNDPEADADFDREFAKMMADSLESRKFERKTVFDVPLPIKRTFAANPTSAVAGLKEPGVYPGTLASAISEEEEREEEERRRREAEISKPGIMAFSLLTKRGNKQQTKEIALPSDSTFAIAMKSKQEADREERQRIKDRVLHYDRMDEEPDPLADTQRFANVNGANLKYGDKNKTVRGKKLQLGDFNWYDQNPNHLVREGIIPLPPARQKNLVIIPPPQNMPARQQQPEKQQEKQAASMLKPLVQQPDKALAVMTAGFDDWSLDKLLEEDDEVFDKSAKPSSIAVNQRSKNGNGAPNISVHGKTRRQSERNFNNQLRAFGGGGYGNYGSASNNRQLTNNFANNSGRNLGRTPGNNRHQQQQQRYRPQPSMKGTEMYLYREVDENSKASKRSATAVATKAPSMDTQFWPELGK